MNQTLKKSHAPRFLAAGTILAIGFAFAAAPTSHWMLDVLCGVAALAGVWLVGIRLAYQPTSRTARRAWQATLVLLLLVGLREFGGPWIEGVEKTLGLERAVDGLVLVTAFGALWLTSTLDEMPHRALALLWAGFVLHLVTMALDLQDGDLGFLGIAPEAADTVVELLQFLCIQLYLLGALAFLAYLRWHVFKFDQVADVGDLARKIFSGQTLVHRYTYPRVRYLGFPGGRYLLTLARFVYWFALMSGPIARRGDRPRWRQLIDLFRLAYRHGLDAQAYYMFELYRPRNWARAGGYLTRYETKNGLLKLLTWQLPDYAQRTPLDNKMRFAAFCRGIGVPTPPVLGTVKNGAVTFLGDGEAKLDQDLFVKPVDGKGSRGVAVYRNAAPGRWLDEAGQAVDKAELLRRVAEHSRDPQVGELMLQVRLRNHPGVADLAEQSLIAVRVITVLQDGGVAAGSATRASGTREGAVIAYAFIRVITRLEPTWPVKWELGIPIDLATGALGPVTADKGLSLLNWWDVHPNTGAKVTGRPMPCWAEIQEIALKAHNATQGRLIVGWDIAVTPDGPLLLEGNSYPDVDFPQRTCRMGIGESPLGAPLNLSLLDLERRIATGALKRPQGKSL
jgi:hypothetical protein